MTLDLSVYTRKLDLVGYVESFSSLLWTRRYFTPGSFRLECPLISANVEQLQLGNVIRKKDVLDDGSARDAAEAGVIEYIKKVDSKGDKYMRVEGRFLSSYLDRRIIKHTKTHTGTSEAVMRAFIQDAVPIPNLVFGALAGVTDTIDKQATWRNLLTVIERISEVCGHGFRIRPDFVGKQMIFEVYDGVDRSVAQRDRARVIFSDEYANLSQSTRELSDLFYKNAFYIGGMGEGDERTVVTLGDTAATGLDLRETFVDARDLQGEDMSAEDYEALLLNRGLEKQALCSITDSLNCEVIPSVNFTYKEDYDLGDIVTVQKPSWGINANLRISSIMEEYIGSNFLVIPTFGDPIPKINGGDSNEW